MTPQERQLVDDLFDRLANVENAPRDLDAIAAITQGLRKAPNAIYALVQTVLLQDEALKRANSRIQELEQAGAPQQSQPGGFLDSMRDTIFGKGEPHGSVPNVPPPIPSRPVWNSGQVLQSQQDAGHYDQGPPQGANYGQSSYGQPAYGQPGYGQSSYGQPYGGQQSAFGGGGSFLGTAAAAAAGMVGGSLLLNSVRSMMGGQHQAFGNTADRAASPWSSQSGGDQSGSSLARDAGINDVGLSKDRTDDSQRAGLLDQASDDDDDRDDMDMDADDFGGDNNGSDDV